MRLALLALTVLLTASGCATIFSGTDDTLSFTSEPSGAQVVIDGFVVGVTPTTVEVDRPGLEEMDVTIRLEGYEPLRFELDKEFNNTSILNIFFWPGFVIDALTGALFKYDKKTYDADLETGAVSLRLDELRRGPDGQYLVPDTQAPVVVTDAHAGLTIRFR